MKDQFREYMHKAIYGVVTASFTGIAFTVVNNKLVNVVQTEEIKHQREVFLEFKSKLDEVHKNTNELVIEKEIMKRSLSEIKGELRAQREPKGD